MATVEPNTPLGNSIGVSPHLLGVEDEIEVSADREEDIEEAGPGEVIEDYSIEPKEEREREEDG